MAQSFTRKMKRGNLIPVWNNTFKQYDFFRKAKNTGSFILTRNPFGSTNNTGQGPGHNIRTIVKWQKESVAKA